MTREEFTNILTELEKNDIKTIYQGGSNYPNKKYNSYYALVGVNDKFYYIEYNIHQFILGLSNLTITMYKKINPYKKQQVDFPHSIYITEDILNYILKTKDKQVYVLSGTCKQDLFLDLGGYTEKRNGVPYTILKELKDIAGYREKYILDNLNYIIEEEKNENYHILKFEDREGNYFKINLKDRKRLIVN